MEPEAGQEAGDAEPEASPQPEMIEQGDDEEQDEEEQWENDPRAREELEALERLERPLAPDLLPLPSGEAGAEGREIDSAGGDVSLQADPDLGHIRLRQRPLELRSPQFKAPTYLIGNFGSISSANTLSGLDPVDDRLLRMGLSLVTSPRLSRRTALVGSISGDRYRYSDLSRLNYDELGLQVSLRHVLGRRLQGDLGWTHRQLFLQDGGDRFLYEHAAFATLTRSDRLSSKTRLTSFYNIRAGFADPDSSSQLRNTAGLSLRHDLTPRLQASVTGRLTLTNFMQQNRQDFSAQGLVQLSYQLSQNFRLNLFGSLTRGNSSNRRVDFDNATFGLSLTSSLKLFE
ncbi:MAG: outer membrane beta-barrel protein [Synechococcales cyanobacterium RM1_1_8]|nr:outer membrane beta-barrel protein [Synechococcales cyanobacterium RM1_1_8]